jgi:hypothetical protein
MDGGRSGVGFGRINTVRERLLRTVDRRPGRVTLVHFYVSHGHFPNSNPCAEHGGDRE